MTPVFQTRFGADGNCWPACLASLLECTIEEVDHCACHNEGWQERTQEFLAKRGLFWIEIVFTQTGVLPFTSPPNGSLCIIGCVTARKRPHVVVARVVEIAATFDGHPRHRYDVVHDPMPGGSSGIVVDAIMFIGKLFN